ncbi:MAG TPA: hypothetical protein PLF22_12460 [Pseudomonadales bacterium]|nr:hypothetical protein [Pseudomonadales bacterium]
MNKLEKAAKTAAAATLSVLLAGVTSTAVAQSGPAAAPAVIGGAPAVSSAPAVPAAAQEAAPAAEQAPAPATKHTKSSKKHKAKKHKAKKHKKKAKKTTT